ncbi:hypothetical protein EAO69_14560 [Streptomyces sp. me109]|nr:hypothetical protein EAO69_14560 [Streptomyces sp. me109]
MRGRTVRDPPALGHRQRAFGRGTDLRGRDRRNNRRGSVRARTCVMAPEPVHGTADTASAVTAASAHRPGHRHRDRVIGI